MTRKESDAIKREKELYRKETVRLKKLCFENKDANEKCPSCELVGWDREGGYCRRCRKVIPSAEAIAAGCLEVQAEWNEETRAKRSGTPYYKNEYRGEIYLNPVDAGSLAQFIERRVRRKSKGSDTKR